MGGLLAAEVVLMPNHDPNLHQPFKHRILGTLSLDSPFLGLHPGIVVSGLSSLFQPAPQPEKETVGSASESSLSVDPSTSDFLLPLSDTTSSASVTSPPPTQTNELYDPPFFNDVPFREKPLFSRLRNFASKHRAEGIFNALGNHIVSHLEFGGCMADYPELSSRYKRIRALEDVDELKAISEGHPAAAHRRVRFVNYYTLSPGRPKPSPQMVGLRVDSPSSSTLSLNQPETDSKEPGEPKTEIESNPIQETQQPPHLTQAVSIASSDGEDLYEADEPKPGLDGKPNAETLSKYNDVDDEDISEHERRMSMLHLDPTPMMEETDEAPMASEGASMPPTGEIQPSFDLAPIPPMPEEPTVHDLTKYTDKDARKQAEKEAKREQKAYQQAIKDRNKAIREREKLLEKRRKKSEKEAQRLEKESIREAQELARQRDEAAAAARAEHAAADAAAATAAPGTSPPPQHPPPPQQQQQPKKLRKFCALPRRDDATWVDIYMADVDEVGAHCGLFTPGAHYDKLVGDVGTRIMAWVHEDLSTRAALDM
ncbi:hypothetical protein CCM_03139 [Cordyceps militaris CM01]|uniref:Uncharacterized protein n=1 Tax=Cordyceps militaris (strain CM01) TaxID=983644 RepID=G3J939_CORMM|nr:uncharacterized protein CCM_03139 [Cordyceps militaris CM01]EGX94868.1 hypothetical protein CCM_03139 [Cordyceps militaris CM01]